MIYPVKSLAGISVTSAILTGAGLKGDREWMLIDENGKYATQRKHPLMATIRPSIKNGQLSLSNLNGHSITLKQPCVQERTPVSVWEDHFQAIPANKEYSAWITESVKSKTPLQLVYFDKKIQRGIDRNRFGPGHTFFADGAPFLVTNTASLNTVNQALNKEQLAAVSMLRFRPNIVISGLAAFDEHRPLQLHSQSNTSIITLKDHCQRCAVIIVEPSTGVRSPASLPFKILAAINPMPNNNKAPAFGVNSVLSQGEGNTIQTGEVFTID